MDMKFSPVTSQSLMQPQQENPVDKMLSIVQNLIQYKSQSADRKFQEGQRSRLLNTQAEEDATNQAVNNMLSGKQPFTTQDVMSIADKVPQNKVNLLLQRATDYVDQEQAAYKFMLNMPTKFEDVPDIASQTGLSLNNAIKLWNEQQQIAAQAARDAKGSGGGTGSGGGGSPEMLQSQAQAVILKKQLKAEGLNYGSHNVFIRGIDSAPRALTRYNGKVYRKTKDGYSVGVDGDANSFKPIKDKKIEDIPESVRKALDEAFTDFETANRGALGKGTDRFVFSGTM